MRSLLPRLLSRLLVGTAALGVVALPAAASATGSTAPAAGGEGAITVFAAASLTDAYTALGEAFEAANPGVDVEFNFAASSDLVTQITEGAPADVFASADTRNMDKLVEAGGNGSDPQTFATNTLEIIVEPGNPRDITGVADLADPDLLVVGCNPDVPIAAYTEQVLAGAGVEVEFDSLLENVRAIVDTVVLGEADAGIVYATDVTAAGDDAEGVEIPADINVVAEYPIATTAESGDPEAAARFVEFVLSATGQDILADYGFGAPDPVPADSTAGSTVAGTATTLAG